MSWISEVRPSRAHALVLVLSKAEGQETFESFPICIANDHHTSGQSPPPTMSAQIPLRTIRIPALQRQCLFHHRQPLWQTTSARAFSSTPSRAYKKKTPTIQDHAQTEAAAQQQVGPSPKVNFEKAQQDVSAMAEDIGLLQNTIVRAPFKDLPKPTSWKFWGYFWGLLKAKGTGFYS